MNHSIGLCILFMAVVEALLSTACVRHGKVYRESTVQQTNIAEVERAKFDAVVQTTYGRYPVTINRGKGCELFDDAAGRKYLDFVAGIATCCLGHADERLASAVADQMRLVHHASNLYYLPLQGKLATWLCGTLGDGYRAFFCNSGGEANEAALKLAFKHFVINRDTRNKEPVILTAYGSFHGRTMATISATAQPKYHGPEACWKIDKFAHFEYNDINSLRSTFEEYQGRIAAVLIEPVQGEGGVVVGDIDFFSELRALCDEEKALLMFDEVQTGVGRTGKMWAHQHLNIVPDVLTCAKGIGGGVPLGSMICAPHCDVLQPGEHATTFGGNPLACAAGLAVAHAINDDGLIDNAYDRGIQLKAGLERLASDYSDKIEQVRGLGLLLGIKLSVPKAPALVQLCADAGLLLVPAGPSVVRFVPPLIVSEEQVTEALNILETALADFKITDD
uniref:acetylornithine transaminase n=1 Tax=Aureoumbra lagunensis TaxID=44058 RepID=A0A7S3JZI0_9STRA|mmetsp:Transcript_19139/g.24832  ORF Transcript_19139/g.24832 Transcript_19139/m.24832 type:complete len:449 (-) Transcript_19139:286-1632(-)|eukprot:CAMPEP_0197326970 /NCGR_PEP_ID=MMETSP0892-20130614/2265_1 /TAXON_ID=44058 ORGANISM="Aureoumbra lagunensis, Strain CCMP1510" /NCGR_SAMPLE_ID=MMETSP0892 /ASSEMBLY_ACC=CAM_ASM_000538 /LENGTH=448 /DNA_ID=CAMNT_0042821419 /DNA_START=29 /DNA_END=1375 /DNA_ORIENTATION=+